MHVLFIPAWWPTRHDPTAGLFIQKQAEAVARLGCRTGCVYFENLLLGPGFLEKSGLFYEKTGGTDVLHQRGRWPLPKKNRWLLDHWAAFHLPLFEKYVARFGRPDVAHAQGYQSVFVAELLLERHGLPFVFTEQSTVFSQKKVPPWLAPHLKKAWGKASAVAALTPSLRDDMLAIWPEGEGRVEVVPNLILEQDWPGIAPPAAPKEGELPQESRAADLFAPPLWGGRGGLSFTFITVCALEEKKGLDILFPAFEKCCQRSSRPLRLVVVGDGRLRRQVAFWAKNSPVSSQIELAGALTGVFLKEKLLASDAFVLASRHETFGVAVVEAMACGLPVVATRCGGPEHIVDGASGLLAEPGDVEGLAAAMFAMVEGRGSFEGEKIRASAMARFSSGAVGRRLLGFYEKAAGGLSALPTE